MTIHNYATGYPIRQATVDEITAYSRMFDLGNPAVEGAVDAALIGAVDLAGLTVYLA